MGEVAKHTAYAAAAQEVAAGRAKAHALWVTLTDEAQRDAFALKPMPWEGTGQYQRVKFDDGRDGFIRIPLDRSSLPVGEPWGRDADALAKAARIAARERAAISKATTPTPEGGV